MNEGAGRVVLGLLDGTDRTGDDRAAHAAHAADRDDEAEGELRPTQPQAVQSCENCPLRTPQLYLPAPPE